MFEAPLPKGGMPGTHPADPADKRGWARLGSIFKGGEESVDTPFTGSRAVEGGAAPSTDIYDRVGGFLRANRLDPTPAHYDLVYRFLCSDDPALIAAIEAAIARDGILSVEAASAIAETAGNQVSAELLDQLIQSAHQSMAMAAGLVTQSTADAKAYGSALEKGAAAVGAGGESATRAMSLLVDLTRTMIGKTQDAERRLRDMGQQMESLQGNLAEAQATAESDPLTGLANRRAFQTRLMAAMRNAVAENYPLSVAFCDIDHFKRINDNFGHETGDRILRLVADALTEGAGEDTFVSRFGGEEFVILFDGIMARRAAMRVDEIRDELQDRSLVSRATGESLGTITFSAGIAQLQPSETPEDMLRRADEAMYKAKAAGRNRVLISGED